MSSEALIKLERAEDLAKLEKVARDAGIGYKVIDRLKKEYTLKSSKYYLGSDELYRETLYFIRQYPEYVRILQEPMAGSSAGNQDGIGSGHRVSRPTEMQAINRAELNHRVNIIDKAIRVVPMDYRDGVWNHVIYQAKYTEDEIFFFANINTWKLWTQRFVYEVAVQRGHGPLIEQLRRR